MVFFGAAKNKHTMKVLKFEAGLFEEEQNLLRIKDVVEATGGRVVVVVPEGRTKALQSVIPGSQVVPELPTTWPAL